MKYTQLKGCPNIRCRRNRERTLFPSDERYCTLCGSELVRVCMLCRRPLGMEWTTSTVCPECQERIRKKKTVAVNIAKDVGSAVFAGLKTAAGAVGEEIRKAADERETKSDSGTGREAGAEAQPILNLPPEYLNFHPRLPHGEKKDPDARFYYLTTQGTGALLTVRFTEKPSEMPYGNVRKVIEQIRCTVGDRAGIIEVRSGKTRKGRDYIYKLLKFPTDDRDGLKGNREYLLSINISGGNGKTIHADASFHEESLFGVRDSEVYASYCKNHNRKYGDFSGWEEDPYDPSVKEGFLMNLSEHEAWDQVYPDHPLSNARRLISHLIHQN